MTDTIAVVRPYYAIEQAYKDGYERFQGMSGEKTDGFDLAPFRESAAYANHVLPTLRAAAGFSDAGQGTYQETRQVAAVTPGCEGDRPADARLTTSDRLLDVLVDAWDRGAHDAVDGREPDADRAPSAAV